LGAAGGIGQPLSLLMKLETNSVSHLALYDIINMGMSADLSHISTSVKVTGHSGEAQLPECLQDAKIVMIPAGVPRKPGMTRDDLFNINAGIVKKLTTACARYCPDAHLLIISNPINSTVPIAYESLKALGISKPSVFGVTTLDIVRAKTFIGELKNISPEGIKVNVLGGHSGPTIVPILSGIKNLSFTKEEAEGLVKRIQYGGDEVVKAKDGGGSATLSMAYAAREFYRSFVDCLDGIKSDSNLISFVKCDLVSPGYVATEIELNAKGLLRALALPEMNEYEKGLFNTALTDLEKDIKKGIEFAQKPLTI